MTNENTSVKFRWHEFYFSRQLIEFLVRHNWPYKFVLSKGFVPLLSKGHFTRDTDKETIRQKTSGLRFHCISGLPPFLKFCTFYEKRNCVSPTLLSPKQTEYVFLDIHQVSSLQPVRMYDFAQKLCTGHRVVSSTSQVSYKNHVLPSSTFSVILLY